MILPDVRDAALDQVTRALCEELHDDSPLLRERAENLIAIALEYSVDIQEELLAWIHYRADGKEWSAAEFRRWSEKLRETKREIERRAGAGRQEEMLP